MSRSATPATRNEATTRLKPPKMTTSAELPIGTAIRGSRGRLRTVADGCERLRTVADGCGRLRTRTRRRANTPSTPRPQSETGTLATHSGIIIPETSPDPVFKSFVPLCFAVFDQVEPTTPPEDARKAGVIDAVGQYLAASHDEFP